MHGQDTTMLRQEGKQPHRATAGSDCYASSPMLSAPAANDFAPCFRTAKLLTCIEDCQWRRACRKPVAEWLRQW